MAAEAGKTIAEGDVVITAAGTDTLGIPLVTKWTGTGVPLGIVVGVDPVVAGTTLAGTALDLGRTWNPVSTAAYLQVCTDPFVLFEAQFDSTAVTLANLHKNASATVTADQTTTLSQSNPYSSVVLSGASLNTTNTLPVRVLGLIQRVDNDPTSSTVAGAYARVLCKWNVHEYTTSTGFTAA
jgi:hypothetical protein